MHENSLKALAYGRAKRWPPENSMHEALVYFMLEESLLNISSLRLLFGWADSFIDRIRYKYSAVYCRANKSNRISGAKQLPKAQQSKICEYYLANKDCSIEQAAKAFNASYGGARSALVRGGIEIRKKKPKHNIESCRKKVKWFNSPDFIFGKQDCTIPEYLYVHEIYYGGKTLAKIGRSKYLNHKQPVQFQLKAIWPMDDRLDSAIYEQAVLKELDCFANNKGLGISGCSEWLSISCDELIDIIEEKLCDDSFYDIELERLCK